jgi:iron(III) transport system substrate-binding protein
VGLLACAGPSAAPPAGGQSGTAAGATSGPTSAPWEAEWEQTLAAAKREGRVSVAGPPGETYRVPLLAFQQAYPDIRVEYNGSSGRDFASKILAERQAGQYLWDVHVGGSDTALTQLAPSGALDPLRSRLIRPDRWDDSKWFNGFDWGFMDEAKERVNIFALYVTYAIYVNRDVVPDAELSRLDDLLQPRFRGRISINEPREAGAGSVSATRLYHSMGRDWLRRLFQNELIVTRNLRQQLEWLVRGQYPIAIGIDAAGLEEFQQQGLGQNVRFLDQVEAAGATGGFGGCACAISNPPHPNAAKVYFDWLLSKEGQTLWAKQSTRNSRRTDVEIVDPEGAARPGVDYFIVGRQTTQPIREEAMALAKETLP